MVRARFTAFGRGLDERSRRLVAAAEAKTAGHGRIAAVSRATRMARSTIGRGLKDLANTEACRQPVNMSGLCSS